MQNPRSLVHAFFLAPFLRYVILFLLSRAKHGRVILCHWKCKPFFYFILEKDFSLLVSKLFKDHSSQLLSK